MSPQIRPKYSFVVPIYDRTQYVKECINSILNQTSADFELIIVLDGSPKETREIVNQYESLQHIRFFSYPESFGTATRARNRGILESKGDFVVFQDSDDISSTTRLDAYDNLLKGKSDPSILYGQCEYFSSGSIWNPTLSQLLSKQSEFHEANYATLLRANIIPLSGAAVRRDVLLRYGGFRLDVKYQEDYELWLRLAFNGCNFIGTDEAVSLYRLHSNNNEKNFKSDDQHWRITAINMHNKPFLDWEN